MKEKSTDQSEISKKSNHVPNDSVDRLKDIKPLPTIKPIDEIRERKNWQDIFKIVVPIIALILVLVIIGAFVFGKPLNTLSNKDFGTNVTVNNNQKFPIENSFNYIAKHIKCTY